MSQVTHCSFHLNIDYWDYYILCRLDIDAARILARMEFWDGTKADGLSHAEAINDRLEEIGEAATQDTSRYVFKTEEELYWELMSSCGEKNIPRILRFLEEDLHYLISRKNPYKGFDRTRQYEFQPDTVQAHIHKLSTIVQAFVTAGRRLAPVQYAVEAVTREGITIETLNVEMVSNKLAELHLQAMLDEENVKYEKGKKPTKPVLPKFIRLAIKKDEKHGFSAAFPFLKTLPSNPQIAEIDTQTSSLESAESGNDSANCGNDSSDLRNRSRNLEVAIPVITISNYNTVITNSNDSANADSTVDERVLASANDPVTLISSLFSLSAEVAQKVVQVVQELQTPGRNNGAAPTVHPTAETPQPVRETGRKASKQQKCKQASGNSHPKKGTRQPAKSEVVQTLQGQHIIDLYQQFKGRKILPTDETVNAANKLGQFVGRDEDLMEVLQAVVDDEFLKKKRVRWDLDYVYRKYDEYFDIIESNRRKRPPSASSGGKTDYTDVVSMTEEQRAEYVQKQREKLRQDMSEGDRETFMKLPPGDRIACLKLSSEDRSAYLKNIREGRSAVVAALA